MSIIDNLRDIIQARYGREVRQAIHDGILEGYNIANDTRDYVDSLTDVYLVDYNNPKVDEILTSVQNKKLVIMVKDVRSGLAGGLSYRNVYRLESHSYNDSGLHIYKFTSGSSYAVYTLTVDSLGTYEWTNSVSDGSKALEMSNELDGRVETIEEGEKVSLFNATGTPDLFDNSGYPSSDAVIQLVGTVVITKSPFGDLFIGYGGDYTHRTLTVADVYQLLRLEKSIVIKNITDTGIFDAEFYTLSNVLTSGPSGSEVTLEFASVRFNGSTKVMKLIANENTGIISVVEGSV